MMLRRTALLYLAILLVGAVAVGIIEILPGYVLVTDLIYGEF